MAGKRIGDLPRQTEFQMTDLLLVEQNGVTKSGTMQQLKNVMKGDTGIPGGNAAIDDTNVRKDAVWSGKKIDSVVGVHDFTVEGVSSILIPDTVPGVIQDFQILGNTVQNPTDLSDIKSVGVLKTDGKCELTIACHGKNAFEGSMEVGAINKGTGTNESWIEYMRSSDYIPVHSSTKYHFRCIYNGVSKFGEVMEYDANKKFIKGTSSTSNGVILSDKTKYVRVVFLCTDTGIKVDPSKFETAMISTIDGVYEAYQGTKNVITLPVPLEKVGNTPDILYFDKGENAWCIDKRIVTLNLKSIHKIVEGNNTNDMSTYMFRFNLKDNNFPPALVRGEVICNCLSRASGNIWFDDRESVDINDTLLIDFRVLKTRLTSQTIQGAGAWVNINDTLVKYATSKPEKIVLPQSVQVSLNSMLSHTSIIVSSGEVSASVKCKVYKSLGGSIQSVGNGIEVLDTRVKTVEGLVGTQCLEYENVEGTEICRDTLKGAIDVVSVQGRTLCSLWDKSYISNTANVSKTKDGVKFIANGGYHTPSPTNPHMMEPNTEYTIVMQILKTTLNSESKIAVNVDYLNESCFAGNFNVDKISVGTYVYRAVTKSDISGCRYSLRTQFQPNCTSGEIEFRILILRGNHSKNVPPFFESILSVGDNSPNGIWAITRKDSGNINPYNTSTVTISGSSGSRWYDCKGQNAEIVDTQGSPIDIYEDGYYYLKADGFTNVDIVQLVSRDGSQYLESNLINSKFLPKGRYNLRFRAVSNSITQCGFRCDIRKGKSLVSAWDECEHQGIQLRYYDQLGGIQLIPALTELCKINKHTDGKWYWHKGGERMTFIGDSKEYWSLANAGQPSDFKTVLFQIGKKHRFANILCDKFRYRPGLWSTDVEGICSNGVSNGTTHIQVRILKSRLETLDESGFKKWLSLNPTSLIFPIEKEIVYPMAPLYLDSFEGDTLVSLEGGLIKGMMEFHILSDINKLMSSCNNRLRILEDEIWYNSQLMLSGDAQSLAYSLYPEDFK